MSSIYFVVRKKLTINGWIIIEDSIHARKEEAEQRAAELGPEWTVDELKLPQPGRKGDRRDS